MSVLSTALAAWASSYIMYKFMRMISMGRRLKAHSYRLISDSDVWRGLLPSRTDIPGVVSGNLQAFNAKHADFDQVGMEAYIRVSLERPDCPAVHLADAEAIKEITRLKAPFTQDTRTLEAFFGIYGPNVLTLEGDPWKRHRRITQKAFSEENVRLVWSESVIASEKLFQKWDAEGGQLVYVSQPTAVTATLALMIISSAALGQRMSWDNDIDVNPPIGYTMSFQQSLKTVAKYIVTRMVTPSWAEGCSENTRRMAAAFQEFGGYLRAISASYRHHGRFDQVIAGTESITAASTENLFKILMTANEEDKQQSGNEGLTDEEITGTYLGYFKNRITNDHSGNAFLFLLAGHETTAHSIAFSLGLLAAYPDIQEEVYAEVKKAAGCQDRLDYRNYGELKLVMGTFLEALRLYPAIPRITRIVEEDMILTVARNRPSDDENSRATVSLPAGSLAIISVTAVHHNAKYWPEPDEFRPSRFSGAYNRDAFLPFGIGRRACMGRRFAETEGVAVLACILSRYEILIDQSKFALIQGETLVARRERLLRPSFMLTLAPENLPLIFRRR